MSLARKRRLAIVFLTAQSLGALVWWSVLLMWPASRARFMAHGAPDITLLSFVVPDLLLFIATSLAAADGFWRSRSWAWSILCIHAGAAGYAGLYCWTLTALTRGDGLLGAILMTPSMIAPGVMVWALRPKERQSC